MPLYGPFLSSTALSSATVFSALNSKIAMPPRSVVRAPMAQATNTILFTASGTYTPTAGAITARVIGQGGGGGGGGGAQQVSGTAVSGGGGGGGGGYFDRVFRVSDLGASVAVTVGAAGTAGAAAGAINTAGGNGGGGTATSFGALAIGGAGGGGAGGQLNATSGGGGAGGGQLKGPSGGNATGPSGGAGADFAAGGGTGTAGQAPSIYGMGGGGGGCSAVGVASAGGGALFAAGGGSSGGGVSAAPASNNGAGGGAAYQTSSASGGTGGTSGTPNGGTVAATLAYQSGFGGGGGYGNAGGNGGNGGNGTQGGGGGGAGSVLNGSTPGTGGAGGAGWLFIIETLGGPPVTTLTNAHTIASPRFWSAAIWNNNDGSSNVGGSFFAYTKAGGVRLSAFGHAQGGFVDFSNINLGSSGLSSDAYAASFMHDGAALEIAFRVANTALSLLIKVDDQYLTLNPLQTGVGAGSVNYFYLNFGSVKKRRIEFISDSTTTEFQGVYTAQTDSIEPAPIRGPRCIVVGDSFIDFATPGTQTPCNSFVQWFGDTMGWDDVWASGCGASGYVSGTDLTGGTPTVGTRLQTDVIAFTPDVVVFTSGYDDQSLTPATVIAAATSVFQRTRAALPNALLFATGGDMRQGIESITAGYAAIQAGINAAITSVGGYFIDMLHLPMINGPAPVTTTLQAGITAGTTTIPLNAYVPLEGSYQFPDGTGFKAKAVNQAVGAPYNVTSAFGVQGSWPSGTVVTQVGDAFMTGNGCIGATTGYGNADLYTGADTVHPSPAGAVARGQTLAMLVKRAIDPL